MKGLVYSPLESARFDLRVFRAEVDAVDVDALVEALRRERVDVAILRLPTPSVAALDALRAHGLAPIIADAIVHYDIDLPATVAPADETLTFRDATPADAASLDTVARETFAGYITHYHANPLFPAEKILDGYGEWAATHAQSNRVGAAAWLIESDGEIAGFSCYRLDRAMGVAVGVLNGILPGMRGRGIYRRMLQQMLTRFGAARMRRFKIATQVQNVAVQRIWVSEGLALRRTDNTVHVNALFGRVGDDGGDSAGKTTPLPMRSAGPSSDVDIVK